MDVDLGSVRLEGQAVNVLRVSEWSETPGPRRRKDGPHSAEEFFETVFRPTFADTLASGSDLTLDMDGGAGYAASFLDELAGRIVGEFKPEDIARLRVTYTEEPYREAELNGFITERLRERGE